MHQLVIVDDEPIIVDGIKNSIDWDGFQINIALSTSDPIRALDFILKNEVNIVITDIAMPTLNGLALIQKIKSEKPSIYIIVLSSFSDFEYTKTALRSGAENYLLKPLDKDELFDNVSQIIRHIKERKELKTYYGYSLLTFRSAFTEQWLKKLISTNEFQSKAEILGVNLDASHYTVMIFSNTVKDASLMSKFLDAFLAKIIGHYSANFYFETPYRLICILSPTENCTLRLSKFIDELLHLIYIRNFYIFTSIGSTVNSATQVPQSYQEASLLSFLSCCPLPSVHFTYTSELCNAVEQTLTDYVHTNQNHETLLRTLFIENPTSDCFLLLLCKALNQLCKPTNDLKTTYPALAEYLSHCPQPTSDTDQCLTYIFDFLDIVYSLMTQSQQNTYPVVDSAIKLIHNFTDKDISLKTLSQKLNISPSYLGTLFNRQTGYYFNDYLSEARLKYAAQLLVESDLKIKDIVEKIGFSSQTYFNRTFKRYYNTSPVNYRRSKTMENLDL